MSRAPDRRAVLRTALRVLDHGPDPAACLRLRREVLRQPADAAEVLAAWAALRASRAYGELFSTQRRDGGWGRFHSEDTRRRQPVPTTEHAVRRALALGVPWRARLLERARIHCEALLAGRQPFPDPPERNDRWPAGWRLFVGATLARIAPRPLAQALDKRQALRPPRPAGRLGLARSWGWPAGRRPAGVAARGGLDPPGGCWHGRQPRP